MPCLLQELRELAVRGVDGPGLHILDVAPDSFKHNEGEPGELFLTWTGLNGWLGRCGCWILRGGGTRLHPSVLGGVRVGGKPVPLRTAGFEAVRDARKALVDAMLAHPPRWFRAREKKAIKEARERAKAKANAEAAAAAGAAGAVREFRLPDCLHAFLLRKHTAVRWGWEWCGPVG